MSTHLIQSVQSLKPGDHACLFYRSRGEQFAVVVPFIQTGLERNETCLYVADDNSVQTVVSALREEGVDAEKVIEKGNLIITNRFDTRIMSGSIEPEKIISFLKSAIQQAELSGHCGVRCACEMTWALRCEAFRRVTEFEKSLSQFFPSNLLMLSQYNQNCFPPSVSSIALSNHRLIISEGKMCSNLSYQNESASLVQSN